METLKVSKSYLNAHGYETVKCTVPGKFEDLECDIIEGKVYISDFWGAGFDGPCKEIDAIQNVLTIKHNANAHKKQAFKKVKLAKEIYDKNKWYTNNDRETKKLLESVKDSCMDILIDYIDKYPSNIMANYYRALLIRMQTSDPIVKELPLNISNKLPHYSRADDCLYGSQTAFMLLLRHIYTAKRKGSIIARTK